MSNTSQENDLPPSYQEVVENSSAKPSTPESSSSSANGYKPRKFQTNKIEIPRRAAPGEVEQPRPQIVRMQRPHSTPTGVQPAPHSNVVCRYCGAGREKGCFELLLSCLREILYGSIRLHEQVVCRYCGSEV